MKHKKASSHYKVSFRNGRLSMLLLLQIALLLIIVVAAYCGWKYITNPQTFPIRNVVIEASYKHIPRQKLEQIIMPYVSDGLFSLNVKKLKRKLISMPWVARAEISRVWPDKVVVKIINQKAIARWNEDALLNPQGEVFKPALGTFPKGLVALRGPPKQAATVLQHYQQISEMLALLKLQVAELTLNSRGSWQVKLQNGMIILLGKVDLIARLQRFIKVYPKLVAKHHTGARIVDLRYPNSLAIKW